ncbi:hypothetical protein C8J56DRAFT_528026 [Mycena floridula]|nr:hypothetical protein C8J56DRAFT_528026 [Mycena floridula]
MDRYGSTPLELDRLAEHCFQRAGVIVLRISYEYIVKDQGDPFSKAGNNAMESSNKVLCAWDMVNQMPILRYIPEWFSGPGFQKQARLWRPLSCHDQVAFQFRQVANAAGTAEPSFTLR